MQIEKIKEEIRSGRLKLIKEETMKHDSLEQPSPQKVVPTIATGGISNPIIPKMAKTWTDTVIRQEGRILADYPDIDVAMEAQAEISFKAGYNQALKDHNLDITTSDVV